MFVGRFKTASCLSSVPARIHWVTVAHRLWHYRAIHRSAPMSHAWNMLTISTTAGTTLCVGTTLRHMALPLAAHPHARSDRRHAGAPSAANSQLRPHSRAQLPPHGTRPHACTFECRLRHQIQKIPPGRDQPGRLRPPYTRYATSFLTCSSVRNMMTFQDPRRPKLGKKPL